MLLLRTKLIIGPLVYIVLQLRCEQEKDTGGPHKVQQREDFFVCIYICDGVWHWPSSTKHTFHIQIRTLLDLDLCARTPNCLLFSCWFNLHWIIFLWFSSSGNLQAPEQWWWCNLNKKCQIWSSYVLKIYLFGTFRQLKIRRIEDCREILSQERE